MKTECESEMQLLLWAFCEVMLKKYSHLEPALKQADASFRSRLKSNPQSFSRQDVVNHLHVVWLPLRVK